MPTGDSEELKQTNEIKMAIPLLDTLEIAGKVVTADALLTQRRLARYLVEHHADYLFTVKANQPTLLEDLKLFFQDRQQPDFTAPATAEHGRLEVRRIWTTTQLNEYLDFPYVRQAFLIERQVTHKKSGRHSVEWAYGVTSQTPQQANAAALLATNRGHWTIENSCHYILDWIFDEDRCRIRTGHGPVNITRLRRFAIGLIKSKGGSNVAQKMRQLTRNIRLVFDYLRMTDNSCIKGVPT